MIYFIVKNGNSKSDMFCHNGEEGCEYMNEHGEYEVWRDPDYHEYVNEYGEHFSPKLAEYASMELKNVDKSNHYWTRDNVLEAIKAMNKEIPSWMTVCDMQYVANMEYAEHFGVVDAVAKTEADILKIACNEAWSPNTYEGEFFLCYITEIMKKGHYVKFADMI